MVLEAVGRGARAVFMNMPAGLYAIGGDTVEIKNSSFNSLHFASRKTGHDYVKGFEANDFRCWYDPELDMITPLLDETFVAGGYEPILTSGNLNEQGQWVKRMAVGEKEYGDGRICVCQIGLLGRTTTNPPAKLFALKLLESLGC